MADKLNVLQISLLVLLYGLILVSVVLSIVATKNLGQEGYDSCIEAKCEKKGQAYCSKFREMNNCCLGSGGKMGSTGSGYVCVFS